jgi:hypothetical protein
MPYAKPNVETLSASSESSTCAVVRPDCRFVLSDWICDTLG